jgi:hypothetical protein
MEQDMNPKKRFTVVSQIEVEGKLHRPAAAGEKPVEIELTEDQAEYLLSVGAIEPVATDVAPVKPLKKD